MKLVNTSSELEFRYSAVLVNRTVNLPPTYKSFQ